MTFIEEGIECEVFAVVEDGKPQIQTINIVGDCVVTYEDLDDEGRDCFLGETIRVMQEKGLCSSVREKL